MLAMAPTPSLTQEQPPLIIHNKYRIEGIVGKGGFGIVCLATDLSNNAKVAVKIEPSSSGLKHEAAILHSLAGGVGIPTLHHYGREGVFTTMVIDMLGPSLQDLFNHCHRRFSLKTTLMLADQLIERLEWLHSRGVIHRDLKPHNLLMGIGEKGHTVHVVDYGLSRNASAKKYAKRDPLNLIGFYGTGRYASVTAHLLYDQSEKDDVESLAYILIYFARGHLPWAGLKGGWENQGYDKIALKKLHLSPEEIAQGLPVEFAKHLRHARSLKSGEPVDYAGLRGMYRRLYDREGYVHDKVFDWTNSQPARIRQDFHDSEMGSIAVIPDKIQEVEGIMPR